MWWKSLRDGIRYRKKTVVLGKSGDSADDDPDTEHDEWPFRDALAFLIPTMSKHPRQTTAFGASEICESTESQISLDETASNYSYVSSFDERDHKNHKSETQILQMCFLVFVVVVYIISIFCYGFL